MDYFPHDTQALSDDKLLALRLQHGGEAVYCYWSLLEKIYADEAPFDLSETNVEATSVLYRLGVGLDTLKTYMSTMLKVGLLYAVNGDENVLMSERAQHHIEQLDKKREIARENGKKRSGKTGKKPRKNKQQTNVGTNVGTNVDVNKTLNSIGCDKHNQILSESCAEAAKPAPLSQVLDPKSSEWVSCPDEIRQQVVSA